MTGNSDVNCGWLPRVTIRRATLPLLLLLLAVCVQLVPGRDAAAADRPIYDDALAGGWADWSWGSTRNLAVASPVQTGSAAISVTLTGGWGALYLHSSSIDLGGYDKLRFWIHGGSAGGQKLRIVANGATGATFPFTATANSWTQVEVPLSSLGGPASLTDLYWQDTTGAPQPTFYLDDISLVAGTVTPPPGDSGPALTIDAAAGRHAISPDIYGMNFADEALAAELRLPVRRRGGNSTSRYNWQNDTANTGSDWYFENIPEDNPDPALLPNGSSADRFVEQDRRTGTKSIITVPLIGWVAKRRTPGHPYDCGFKVSLYGAQDSVDSWETDCGNGVKGGANITGNLATDTSVATTTAFVGDWVNHLKGLYGTAANGGVAYYNLDNEPMLWNSTHRDVHPQATSYDEMRDRTWNYAAAIKAADPTAKTLGPVLWGWTAYFYSALDAAAGGNWWDTRPDRKLHDDVPFVAWYLQQMQLYEQQHAVRILDYLDLHYYPQASGVSLSTAGSATTQALRLRSTRSLWDPDYPDESWISDTVRLIPRMREWVSANYPGTRLAITEYNWGGLEHINGALTQADLLGIFGREGLDLATIWGPPAATQPGAYAFRIYRNYDGTGRGFGETGVLAASTDQSRLAVYAAQRGSDSHLTVVAVNKSGSDLTSSVTLANFPVTASAAVYRYSPANLAAIEHPADLALTGGSFSAGFPANSITLLDIPPLRYPLTVTTTGTGSGRVTSIPAGIDCHSGSEQGCSASFVSGTKVTLQTAADNGFRFALWNDGCSGSAGCSPTIGGPVTVTAVFTPDAPVIIGPTGYPSLQTAYDAASDNATIKLTSGTLAGPFRAWRPINVAISGGLDAAFLATGGLTALQGKITLEKGKVTMGGVTVQSILSGE